MTPQRTIHALGNAAPRRQTGIALVVALIFLVIISIIGISAVKFTSQDVRSALNDEFRMDSFQIAQSIVDATISQPGNTPVNTAAGITNCTATPPPDVTCAANTITLAGGVFAAEVADGRVQASVTRTLPLFAPPPRGSGASVNLFFAANFQIQGAHDETAAGRGRTQINQGLILVLNRF